MIRLLPLLLFTLPLAGPRPVVTAAHYARAEWTKGDLPVLVWSPDSTKIATFQQDERGVLENYLVETNVGHPKLSVWKYPFAGDQTPIMIQRVIVDEAAAKVIRLQMPPDQH